MNGALHGLVWRRLDAADAAQYRALRLEGLRLFPHAFRSDYEEAAALPAILSATRLSAKGDYWLGVFDGGKLAGAVGLRTQQGRKVRHVAELIGMVVAPAWQGRGVGRLLVAQLIAQARALGHIRQIQLTVTDGNAAAEKLYASFGFEQYGLEREAIEIDGAFYAKQLRQLFLK
ncbi:MAG TPA: GNAT family N-acetyltransferase [Burkholderiaceae bacterium]